MDMHPAPGRAPARRRAGQTTFALAAALLCGLALAACESDNGSRASDEDQVRELARQLAANDPAACDKLTEDFLKRQFGTREQCEATAEEYGDAEKPTVEDVGVDGDTGTAALVDENRTTLEFVREDGEWLAAGVAIEVGAGEAGSSEGDTGPEENGDAADTSDHPPVGRAGQAPRDPRERGGAGRGDHRRRTGRPHAAQRKPGDVEGPGRGVRDRRAAGVGPR